jgi:hypothetical protein
MFGVEEQILKCWEISEDLQLLAEQHEHDDEICNKILGIKHVYELRFNKLWTNYEEAIKEYYRLKGKPEEPTIDKEEIE